MVALRRRYGRPMLLPRGVIVPSRAFSDCGRFSNSAA